MARRNDHVSVSITRHTDGAITGSVSGAASDVGDVVERFGRGVGYGMEKARLEKARLENGGRVI